MSYDDYSCIKVKTENVIIILSTEYQGNNLVGISNILDSWKRQYVPELQGIVVSYRDVILVSKCAHIRSDYPIIRCNVKATFELFIPTVGSIVKGKVNRISYDYIGCLVHNSINVAIDRSRNEYDSISNFISLDQTILFEITHIGLKRKVIRVKGKITQECINLMKSLYPSAEETDAANHDLFTSLPQGSRRNTDSEEHENNYDTDSVNESRNLLCDNIDLLDGSINDVKYDSSTKKKSKKKSNKVKAEKRHDSQFETLGLENGEVSPSLLCNNSRLLIEDINDVSHNPSTKMEKSNTIQTEHSNFQSFESTVDKSGSISPNSLFSESFGLLGENSTDRDSYHSKKKKKKSKKKLETEQITDELPVNFLSDISPASNYRSPKKKKSKQDNDSFSDTISYTHIKVENSTDTSSHLSSSTKKKKHKKSKSNVLSSPPLFSDSLSSSKDEIEPINMGKSSPKKQQKLSQDKFSVDEMRPNFKDFNLTLHEENILNPLITSVSLQKPGIKTEDFDNLMEALSPYDPSLGNEMCNEVLLNDTCLKSTKKAKKRKRESIDADGLPKKRKKIEEGGDTVVKSTDKKKKKKEKSKKDSKKDKKKSKKIKVISSKKKLPKLKKEKKLTKKNIKKSSKHKKKDVP